MLTDLRGEFVTREPGSLRGYDFVIDGCEGSEIRLLDHTAQVQVDYCKDSKILIGPVGGSVFARNCERCVIVAACQQLRTRECVDCDIILLIPGHPIIESSRDIRFGEMPRDHYSELEDQMTEAKLTVTRNDWANIYDFSPKDPPDCTHSSLLAPEDTAKLLRTFPARLSAPGGNKLSTESANEATVAREVRVTSKKGAQFHANLCRAYLEGRPEVDDKPAMVASPSVLLIGADAAVATAGHTATLLEQDKVARITSITTGMMATPPDASTEQPKRSQRPNPTIRILLERLGA